MSQYGIRKLLWGCVGLAGLATLAVGVTAVLLPVEVPQPQVAVVASQEQESIQVPVLPPLSEFEAVMQLKLRRPLVDPAPVVVAEPRPPPPPPPPALQVELAGTVLEPGRSLAILRTQDGRTQMKGVGQSVGEAEVLRVDRRRVTLLYHGREVVLKVPLKEGDTNGRISDAE